jgi:DeoR/GlpR family transcriptional regulator of sugar metabolism
MTESYDFVREEVILQELTSEGRVLVNDLSHRLGVSTVTVRKDLDSLEKRSLLRRVRGGAVVLPTGEEGAFTDRMRRDSTAKRLLAQEVATLVKDGDVIALDSSTTSFYLAHEILDRNNLIVVTYSLRAATLLMEHSTATVVMPGGVLRRASGALIGAFSNVLEGRGRINKGFFGLAAVSLQLGLLELVAEEAATKRSLLEACDEVFVTLPSSKIGGFGLHSFAKPNEITRVFTDELASDQFVDEWGAAGTAVTRVQDTGVAIANSKRSIDAVIARRLRAVDE